MPKRKFLHKLCKFLIIGFLAAATIIFLINFYILQISKSYIYQDSAKIPKTEVAIILGSKVKTDGEMSDVLKDRAITGLELYNAKKVDKLLVSGDHGTKDYDEVNAVKKYLLEKGVKKEDIFLDHAGFDTYDSMYRAKNIFQIDSAIIVTQKFHLPRAIYIARSLGIDAHGMVADKQTYVRAGYFEFRENFARMKAFMDIVFNAKPQFLGKVIPIQGNGTLSWD